MNSISVVESLYKQVSFSFPEKAHSLQYLLDELFSKLTNLPDDTLTNVITSDFVRSLIAVCGDMQSETELHALFFVLRISELGVEVGGTYNEFKDPFLRSGVIDFLKSLLKKNKFSYPKTTLVASIISSLFHGRSIDAFVLEQIAYGLTHGIEEAEEMEDEQDILVGILKATRSVCDNRANITALANKEVHRKVVECLNHENWEIVGQSLKLLASMTRLPQVANDLSLRFSIFGVLNNVINRRSSKESSLPSVPSHIIVSCARLTCALASYQWYSSFFLTKVLASVKKNRITSSMSSSISPQTFDSNLVLTFIRMLYESTIPLSESFADAQYERVLTHSILVQDSCLYAMSKLLEVQDCFLWINIMKAIKAVPDAANFSGIIDEATCFPLTLFRMVTSSQSAVPTQLFNTILQVFRCFDGMLDEVTSGNSVELVSEIVQFEVLNYVKWLFALAEEEGLEDALIMRMVSLMQKTERDEVEMTTYGIQGWQNMSVINEEMLHSSQTVLEVLKIGIVCNRKSFPS